MVSRAVLAASLLMAGVAQGAASTPDPWAGLRFLLGEWTVASGGGTPGEAVSGGFTFQLELDGQVAVRRAHSEYAPKPGERVGVKHSDLVVLSPSAAGLRATYWDNEGHVIEYTVKADAGVVTFESDAAAPGPRFKLVYERQGENEVTITFSMAPPGGKYQTYVSGRAIRRR
ncbi:MAG TPA: hypothetical protein VK454_03415 [Myxococcaceae bacterium]|nr:hypothetical protein [Myxococcaceae bacterium]